MSTFYIFLISLFKNGGDISSTLYVYLCVSSFYLYCRFPDHLPLVIWLSDTWYDVVIFPIRVFSRLFQCRECRNTLIHKWIWGLYNNNYILIRSIVRIFYPRTWVRCLLLWLRILIFINRLQCLGVSVLHCLNLRLGPSVRNVWYDTTMTICIVFFFKIYYFIYLFFFLYYDGEDSLVTNVKSYEGRSERVIGSRVGIYTLKDWTKNWKFHCQRVQ